MVALTERLVTKIILGTSDSLCVQVTEVKKIQTKLTSCF